MQPLKPQPEQDEKNKKDKNIPYCSYGKLYQYRTFKKEPNDYKR